MRPTSGRVREALFSLLVQRLGGRAVLDCFAGAGTLGIEAASRGASRVVFVENEPQHLVLLRRNAALLDGVASWELLASDVPLALHRLAAASAPFDLVFVDPPYASQLGSDTLCAIAAEADGLLGPGATVVIETDGRRPPPDDAGPLRCVDRRRYGPTGLSLYRDRRSP